MNARRRAHRRGVFSEIYCMLWLLLRGYTILARRHRNRGGEIDLIASRGRITAFIEVKARAGLEDALASITADKRRRLSRAAELWRAEHPRPSDHGLRFDVMVVTSRGIIHHLSNAWSL